MAASAIGFDHQTAPRRSPDLSGRTDSGRHSSTLRPTARGPAGPRTGQRRHERRNLCLCRIGVQPQTAAQDFHLHLYCLGAAVVRRPAGRGVAYPEFELALGVPRCDSTGALRRRNGVSQPPPHDALVPAKRPRCPEARAVMGCRTPCGRRRHLAARGSAVELGHCGASHWRFSRPAGGAATAHATRILAISSWPLAGHSDTGFARWRLLRRRGLRAADAR